MLMTPASIGSAWLEADMNRVTYIVMNLDVVPKKTDPRDSLGYEMVTANPSRSAARYAGELCAELSPEHHFEMIEVSLH